MNEVYARNTNARKLKIFEYCAIKNYSNRETEKGVFISPILELFPDWSANQILQGSFSKRLNLHC